MTVNVKYFSIGADPELFVQYRARVPHRNVPACKVTTGTKEKPEEFQNGIKIHADNVCLEFNIPPSDNKQDFTSSILCAKSIIEDLIRKDREMVFAPAVVWLDAELKEAGEEASIFHCHPDKFCWGERKEPYKDLVQWRVAGGHVHLGWKKRANPVERLTVARACDYFIGLRSVIYEQESLAARRRMYYGSAGSFRECPYGIEYRTPSNFWIRNNELIGKMFDWGYEAVHRADDWQKLAEVIPEDAVQNCINTCNKGVAERYLKALGLEA